ncbi:SDR family NAD(P)-dependent oxidoreductase [Ferrimicrobium sp.]|uniref:SDR family NAD(P)-dependent oxidoreductase n=1 Tax=Ferrimicrobium sp. TaxID=2926050 RepID=UPI00261F4B0C|nr:SDR family NAD(P)-dependent oxidoreductase [Ferrimicrobium sp.]
MLDSRGLPEHVLVIGGGSEIARALLLRLGASSLRSVLLLGPHAPSLTQTRTELLKAYPELAVEIQSLDLADIAMVDPAIQEALEGFRPLDAVIMAAGWLGTQPADEQDPSQVALSISVNFTGPAMALTRCADRFQQQGHGLIVVLSSVAGERVRQTNYLYGAAKAGIDGFSLGLADRLYPRVQVLVVRPGFVTTAMTRGRPRPPLSTESDRVARDIVRGITRRASIVWSPRILQPIMVIYRHLPRSLARRLPY